MLYALDANNAKTRPLPGSKAVCPGCGGSVVPKCGKVKIWHWAHRNQSCDWCAGETDWHRQWKLQFPPDCVEVRIGDHRADAVDPQGRVWEFQSKTLSLEEIQKREATYSKLVWVWKAEGVHERLELQHTESKTIKLAGVLFDDAKHQTLIWQRPRERIGFCQKTVLLDFGEESDLLFLISKSGWGWSADRLALEIPVSGGRYLLQGYLLQRSLLIQRVLEFD